VHDLCVGQLPLEAPGLEFPDPAVVAAGACQLDIDAAQAAGRLAQRTCGGALILQAGDGGGLVQYGDAHDSVWN
jgi:hypothetical protein